MATFQVEVVSAEKKLFSGEASEVYARSLDGEIGILPGHQPALLALAISPVKIHMADGTEVRIAVHNGFLYYKPGDKLVILANIAEMADDIDVARATRREAVLTAQLDKTEDEILAASLKKQMVRLSVAGG
ncbi:MAG: F-type H+-transporting ATPase subunit epsilon [Glaciecola sp.]|jgi:F-type H+-transporting ATPase subunit epsilon